MNSSFDIVVAATKELGIGMNGKIPWELPVDLKRFKQLTTSTVDATRMNCCIMGKKTFFSIPSKYRPLPGRINIVLSKDASECFPQGVHVQPSVEKAMEFIHSSLAQSIENVFVIGGAQLYAEAIQSPNCKRIYFTMIHSYFECDAFFPKIDRAIFRIEAEHQIEESSGIRYQFMSFVNSKFQK